MCKLYKEYSEFHKRGNGHQAMCKPCRKIDDQVRYTQDHARRRAVEKIRHGELLQWLWGIKQANPCTDCGGYFHPVAMQWDHIGDDKVIAIANAVRSRWSMARILKEISKCELVCANCHAVRTYERHART